GDDRGHRERSRHARRREVQALEEAVDERRALHEIAHEHEQGHRDQHVVRHDAVGALHHQVEDLVVRERRIGRAIGEPAEEDAQPHQREGGRESEHDGDDDQRQHDEAEVAVRKVGPRREYGDGDEDDRHQREPEPQLFSYFHLRGSFVTYRSSLSMSSSLTWTISFSLSTSTSWTSSSREGQWPCLRQMMQRMISTIPCIRMKAPATGITVLKG